MGVTFEKSRLASDGQTLASPREDLGIDPASLQAGLVVGEMAQEQALFP